MIVGSFWRKEESFRSVVRDILITNWCDGAAESADCRYHSTIPDNRLIVVVVPLGTQCIFHIWRHLVESEAFPRIRPLVHFVCSPRLGRSCHRITATRCLEKDCRRLVAVVKTCVHRTGSPQDNRRDTPSGKGFLVLREILKPSGSISLFICSSSIWLLAHSEERKGASGP